MVFTGRLGFFPSNNECIKNHATFQERGKELSFTSTIGNQRITAKIVIQEMKIYFCLAYKDDFIFPWCTLVLKIRQPNLFQFCLGLHGSLQQQSGGEIIDPPRLPPTKILDSFLIVFVLITGRFQAEHQLVLS